MDIVRIELSRLRAWMHPRHPEDELRIGQIMQQIERGGSYEPLIVASLAPQARKRGLAMRIIRRLLKGLYEAFPLDAIVSRKWSPNPRWALRKQPTRANPARDAFEIIEGHLEYEALRRLGCDAAECTIWNWSNEQVSMYHGMRSTHETQNSMGFQVALFDVLQPRLKTYSTMSSKALRLRATYGAAAPPQTVRAPQSAAIPAPRTIDTSATVHEESQPPKPKLTLSN